MKLQHNLFKWLGMAFFFATFISFTFLLPPAFAQEENPETETPSMRIKLGGLKDLRVFTLNNCIKLKIKL